MAALKDVVAFLLLNYPSHLSRHLSNARVTKMVYLADWKHAIHNNGKQITNIDWFFDNFGPFDHAIQNVIEENPHLFSKTETETDFGNPKVQFSIADRSFQPDLQASEITALNHVIQTTQNKSWADFIKLVYSTYPVFNSNRYTKLNIPEFAREYARSLKIVQFA